MVRVVVVDDEPMVCAHLRTILGSADDIEVVGEAYDGAAGVEGCQHHNGRRAGQLADSLDRGEPVDARHAQVHEHNVRPVAHH